MKRITLDQAGITHVIGPLLAFLLVGVIGGYAFLRISHADTVTSPDTINGIAGKCLDNYHSQESNGNKIDLWSCNGTDAQQWFYNTSSDTIVNSNGRCLDVYHAGTVRKTLVDLWSCNGTDAQQWTVNEAAKSIVNPHSGLCLDDQWGHAENGNQIWVYTCNGTPAQQWTVKPVVAAAPPHVLVEEYAVAELNKVPTDIAFVQSLNTPSTYEDLNQKYHGPDLLPQATHMITYKSYQDVENAFKYHKIPANVKVVLYDDERWSGTPMAERQQPFVYVPKVAALVHQHGLLFANAPAPDLNTSIEGNGQYNNYDGYIHLRLATLAKYADIFDIQAQRAGSVAKYVSFADSAYAQARAVNTHAIILLGITTADNQTSQDLINQIQQTRYMADGYWLNVINGPSVLNPVIQRWPAADQY